MLRCVCSIIDHRRRQNVVRTSVTHSAIASCATFLFLPHFDVICDLLLNRRTATWNLFVKYTNASSLLKEQEQYAFHLHLAPFLKQPFRPTSHIRASLSLQFRRSRSRLNKIQSKARTNEKKKTKQNKKKRKRAN